MRIKLLTCMLLLTGCSNSTYLPVSSEYLTQRENRAEQIATSLSTDSDRDGVVNYWDHCRDTKQGVQVTESGCPLDSNGNGIPDYLDDCENNGYLSLIDTSGCGLEQREKVHFFVNNVLFTSDSAEINSDLKLEISKLFLEYGEQMNAGEVVITGHTDNLGNSDYNLILSQLRARSVATFLTRLGMDPVNLTVQGKGENEPVGDNRTMEGRRMNRRVEIYHKVREFSGERTGLRIEGVQQ